MISVSPARAARALLAAILACACGGSTGLSNTENSADSAPAAVPRPGSASAARAAPDGLDEARARALLAARFRGAGLRVRYDVPLAGAGYVFTADGYDPERGIGYEYVALVEEQTDLTHAEADALAADPGIRVLVIYATGPLAIHQAAEAFLADQVAP